MPFKDGEWGEQAKERNERRGEYFREHYRQKIAKKGKTWEIKNSLGFTGELESLNILKGAIRNGGRSIVDLDFYGERIEVKTSNILKHWGGKNYLNWKFLVKKQRGKCDKFLLICKGQNSKTQYVFLIPDKKITTDSIIISLSTIDKYSKYLIGGYNDAY